MVYDGVLKNKAFLKLDRSNKQNESENRVIILATIVPLLKLVKFSRPQFPFV